MGPAAQVKSTTSKSSLSPLRVPSEADTRAPRRTSAQSRLAVAVPSTRSTPVADPQASPVELNESVPVWLATALPQASTAYAVTSSDSPTPTQGATSTARFAGVPALTTIGDELPSSVPACRARTRADPLASLIAPVVVISPLLPSVAVVTESVPVLSSRSSTGSVCRR